MIRRYAVVVLAAAACGGGTGEGAGTQETVAGSAVELIRGTPVGGLAEWIADVERGVADLADVAGRDAAEAQRQALDLYISRQEYIEMYYGPGGRLAGGASLGTAVTDAEERFHELMQMLGAPTPPQRAAVESARDALIAQLAVVLREAGRAGVPLDPRAVTGGPR